MEMFATLAGATIQGQIVGVYHAKKAQACSELNESIALTGNYSSLLYHNSTTPFTATLQETVRHAYSNLSHDVQFLHLHLLHLAYTHPR